MASWHLRLSLGQVRALGAHGARGALGTRVYLRIDGARHSEGWAQSETAVFHNFEEKLCHSHCIVCTMACYFVMVSETDQLVFKHNYVIIYLGFN